MLPAVRDLYKRFLVIGAHYPEGLEWVRRKVKEGFRQNAHLTDVREINKAVGKGRYIVRETEAFLQFKKYRAMRERYGVKDEDKDAAVRGYAAQQQQQQQQEPWSGAGSGASGGSASGGDTHSGSDSGGRAGGDGGRGV